MSIAGPIKLESDDIIHKELPNQHSEWWCNGYVIFDVMTSIGDYDVKTSVYDVILQIIQNRAPA